MTLKAFSSIINSWKEKLTSHEEDFEGSLDIEPVEGREKFLCCSKFPIPPKFFGVTPHYFLFRKYVEK